MDRRAFTLGGGALLLSACAARPAPATAADEWSGRLSAIERAAGGRLGVQVIDTATGRGFGWRADERFCHCSTFKLSLAAMLLREGDAGRIDVNEVLPYSRADLMAVSPVTEANVDKGGLSAIAMAEATQITSDNAAANVLMRRLGGPAALTAFWRDLGDTVSRIDGYEPAINVIPPGTTENSTTPAAMARTLQRIAVGDALLPASRARLLDWMARTRTGVRRIAAGLPEGWRSLDKTGTGMTAQAGNKVNDIALIVAPGRAPLVVTAYFENPVYSDDIRPADEAVLKQVGALAAQWAK